MPKLEPYQPPGQAAVEEAKMIAGIRQPVRKAVFGTLFAGLLVSLAIVGPLFGLIGGLVLAVVGGVSLTFLYNLTSPRVKPLNPALHSGETSCPRCGSVQTDQSYTQTREGRYVLQWQCFACDHTWPVG